MSSLLFRRGWVLGVLGGVLADGAVYPDGGLDASLFGFCRGRGAGASALFLFAGCDASGDYPLDADGSVPQELWDAKGVPFDGGFGGAGGGHCVLSLLDVRKEWPELGSCGEFAMVVRVEGCDGGHSWLFPLVLDELFSGLDEVGDGAFGKDAGIDHVRDALV